MQFENSYKQIFVLALPLMAFQLAQNLVGFTDTIFLGRIGEVEMGACVVFSVFYYVIQMIGYGLSRGGQILISRRAGEANFPEIGKLTDHLLVIMMGLALIMFLALRYGLQYFLPYFIQNEAVLNAGLEYLEARSFGIFFSYFGFVMLALYTGIGKTGIIFWVTVSMGVSNIFLAYGFIFGAWGLPVLGMKGAGLASALAEMISSLLALVYVIRDPMRHQLDLFQNWSFSREMFLRVVNLSYPVILQYIVGLGGWFLFFTFIENLGERSLAVSGIMKQLYTFYCIPAWSIATASNSLVSNLMGQEKQEEIALAIGKSVILSVAISAAGILTLQILPDAIISLFRNDDSLIADTKEVMYVLYIVILSCAFSTVVFNGLMGTGATKFSLLVEFIAVVFYVGYAYIIINHLHKGLVWAWMGEFWYWILLLLGSLLYLRWGHWRELRV